MSRKDPVVDFGLRPEPGPLRRVLDILHALFGKVVSLSVVALLLEVAGHTVTNAATGAGTALTTTRTTVDFQDAGVDSVRLVIRAKNSALTDLIIQAYNVTTSATIATASMDIFSQAKAWPAIKFIGPSLPRRRRPDHRPWRHTRRCWSWFETP